MNNDAAGVVIATLRSHLETATAENERLARENVVNQVDLSTRLATAMRERDEARRFLREAGDEMRARWNATHEALTELSSARAALETARKALEALIREAQTHYEDARCELFDGGLVDALEGGRDALCALDTPAATPEAPAVEPFDMMAAIKKRMAEPATPAQGVCDCDSLSIRYIVRRPSGSHFADCASLAPLPSGRVMPGKETT